MINNPPSPNPYKTEWNNKSCQYSVINEVRKTEMTYKEVETIRAVLSP